MISLCIISRQEDTDSLLKAIRSCIQFVDEVVIIDTSKESAITLPADLASVCTCIPYTWTNDFAAARNFSFKQASNEVIFWLDSDDMVLHPEHLPELAKHIEAGTVDWIYLDYLYATDTFGNITARHWKPRLLRRGTGVWDKSVHEDFTPLMRVVQAKDSDLGTNRVLVAHHTTEEHLQASARRNLTILQEESDASGDSCDPRTWQYLAMTYQALNQYDEALHYFMRHLQVTGSQEDKYWSLERSGFCLKMLGRYPEAVDACISALKIKPEWNVTYFAIAECYAYLEQYQKVIEWSEIGFTKSKPDTLQVVSDLDLGILPLGRLGEAYLHTGNYLQAQTIAERMESLNPEMPAVKEFRKLVAGCLRLEGFVTSFLEVVQNVRKYDRVYAGKLFDLLPKELDDDVRIQQARKHTVPPRIWEAKSVVIYCGKSLEDWAYPSQFTGIGGSEEAVINLSEQLVTLGYTVTVYNQCGALKGTYNGVTYCPYYYFNPKDHFSVLISWRNPAFFTQKYKAHKSYLWLHDIAYPEYFNETIYANLDKILFLSQWHRNNLPECPEEKVYLTNNGINPEHFLAHPAKKPYSLIWSSSYDRGLLPFIQHIFPLIQKSLPEVTLDVCYGWQNILKEKEQVPQLAELYDTLSPLLEHTPGITHHGRLSHMQLVSVMEGALVYPYASEFGETNNITSQKCQAAGCYVITAKQSGGTPERVLFGEVVDAPDIYSNKKSQKLFADKVIAFLKQPTVPVESVLTSFSWKTTALNWSNELL